MAVARLGVYAVGLVPQLLSQPPMTLSIFANIHNTYRASWVRPPGRRQDFVTGQEAGARFLLSVVSVSHSMFASVCSRVPFRLLSTS
uniref:Putative secreted protein n=1 Tax=Anopheles marajoara TaxID=58244 RepID=A0A2M4CAN8_9DIPT